MEEKVFTVNVKVATPVTHLIADMNVRYWDDATVNGAGESEDTPTIPFSSAKGWRIKVDLATGVIDGWPQGVTAKTHYKVCDAGVYTLYDAEGEMVLEKDGYVPAMLCPNNSGYGDYVILSIDEEGRIDGFSADLLYFEEDEE